MTLDTSKAKKTTETQVAIRLKQQVGYRYERYVDYGPGTSSSSANFLTLETAKRQLSLYTADSEATIVVREAVIFEGEWETVENTELYDLASLLHKKQCHYNHEDQCAWYYENWNGYARKEYLAQAKKIVAESGLELEAVIRVFKAL